MTTAVAEQKAKSDAPAKSEQNGHLTRNDEYRRKISGELSSAYRTLGKAQMRLERCKAEQKAAKGDVEAAQQEVNDLVAELRDIELGQYQPDLFDKDGPASAGADGVSPGSQATATASQHADEGAAMPIAALKEFGLSEKKCEALAESKFEIKTVGDLERTIRENEWWHRDIKGFGETTIDKLTEALTEFRLTYPVPVPEELEPDGASDAETAANDVELTE